MNQTQSSKLVFSQEMAPLVDTIRAAKTHLRYWSIPSLDDLLSATSPHFAYDHDFDEAKGHPILILHSSGSTGLPKPVIMTNGSFAVVDNDRNFPSVPDRRNHDLTVWDFPETDARIYEPFPPFHLAGFFNKVTVPLFTHTIPIFGPPSRPPSGALAAEIMQQQRLRGLFLPPIVAEQLLQEPAGLDYFKDLDVFCYAGGPLSQAAGDAISQVTTVCQFYGSTELGQVRQLLPKREDWSYMQFHPLSKLELQPAEDNAYELVVFADPSTDGEWALNHNYPGVREWRTKDLFRPHPDKEGLWQFYGRRDDILVLSNGEKFNPVPTETALQQHPSLAGALIVGQGRPQPALLVEPRPDLRDSSTDILKDVWPLVELANLKAPGHGHISKSMMLATAPEKPFVRAGKGTIVRKLTEEAYRVELDGLYEHAASAVPTSQITLPSPIFNAVTVFEFVRSILKQVLPSPELGNDDNLYSFGLDSLKTLETVRILKSSLRAHRPESELSWMSSDLFYRFPTIKELGHVLLAFLNERKTPGPALREIKMSAILEELRNGLSASFQANPAASGTTGFSVALTGFTGWLGFHLLEALVNEPSVTHVYCLSRSVNAHHKLNDRQKEVLQSKLFSARLTFLAVQYDGERLGLNDEAFQDLQENCDLLIHNAWKVDFNHPLEAFRANLSSVRTLANLSLLSPRRPRIIFISSISSVGPWGPTLQEGRTIPEKAITKLNAPLEFGYAESKFVAERFLDIAASQHGLPVSILRIGQIAGSTWAEDQSWPVRDHVVSMLRTSKSLKSIPADLPDVDWIPIDVLSKSIVEIAFSRTRDPDGAAEYFNLVNWRPVPWNVFTPIVQDFCGPSAKIIPLAEWIQQLQTESGMDDGKLESMPALRLLYFFALLQARGPVAKYETYACRQASPTMGRLTPVTPDLMRLWLQQIFEGQ